MPSHFLRDYQLAAVFFGEVLQTAGDVYGITDGGETYGRTIAHAPNHGRSAVDSDADLQRLCQLAGEELAQVVNSVDNLVGRGQRPTAAVIRISLDAEERHHAVTNEFIDDAASLRDGFTGGLKVTVQDEDKIIRQFVLRHSGERPKVCE